VPRTSNRLSARRVEILKERGFYADGHGLYLRVGSATTRSWVFVWHEHGKRREMGLGSLVAVSLAMARERAQQARIDVANGLDPKAIKAPPKPKPTFGELADAFIADRKDSVRSIKSVERWERAIGADGYAEALRKLAVDKITTDDVVNVLRPMWRTHPSSAGLLRGYIEAVLAKAKVEGHRTGENPAIWKGHLALILPARSRLTRGHHAALPYDDLPDFMVKLATQNSMGASALQLTILTATRTSEALNATWEEFDFDRAIWTIPATRMKAGKEHRIPLSSAVVALLQSWQPGTGYVFPGQKPGRPLCNMTMEMVLRRMEVKVTVHGFRSTFRDWAGEATDTPREVAEAALAHTVGNSAELAYRRGDALEKRRQLMEAWAGYCSQPETKSAPQEQLMPVLRLVAGG
jgi:integrase